MNMASFQERLKAKLEDVHIQEQPVDLTEAYRGARRNRLLKTSLVSGVFLGALALAIAFPLSAPLATVMTPGAMAWLTAGLGAAGIMTAAGAGVGLSKLGYKEVGKHKGR
jgi:hypothetical protein